MKKEFFESPIMQTIGAPMIFCEMHNINYHDLILFKKNKNSGDKVLDAIAEFNKNISGETQEIERRLQKLDEAFMEDYNALMDQKYSKSFGVLGAESVEFLKKHKFNLYEKESDCYIFYVVGDEKLRLYKEHFGSAKNVSVKLETRKFYLI